MNRKMLLTCALAVLAGSVAGSRDAHSADTRVVSETSLHVYETDSVIGESERRAPLYEHLSVRLPGLADDRFDLYLSGWARVDAAADDDTTAGELSSGYLEYRHGRSRTRAMVGRFFLTEGTAAEVLDGVMVKGRLPQGFGGSLFVGNPVEDTRGPDEGGDSLFGGRGSWNWNSRLEVGVTWLTETGDFSGQDREEAGTDLWFMPARNVEILGRSVYNLATEGTASYRAVLRFLVSEPLVVQIGGEGYDNEHLLQAVTTAALGFTTLDPTDEVRTVFALVDWTLTETLGVTGSFKNISHSVDDPGDARRGELGIRLNPFAGTRLGLSAATVTADLARDEYMETRGYIMTGVGSVDLALDLLNVRYEVPIDGEDTALQLVGSAGTQLFDDFRLSGDVRYTTSPTFDKDLALFVRAVYTL